MKMVSHLRDGSTQPARRRLETAEVDVWRANLDEPSDGVVAAMRVLLSPDETERARRFFFARDRRRYVMGRGILRTILGRYLGRPAGELAFTYGAHGKPALAAGAGAPPIFFNVAHTEALALYAFTRAGEIGVDIERVRELPEWEQVAATAFSPQELARLNACPSGRRNEEFFHAWARQEAVLKALGTGLSAATAAAGPARAFTVHPLNVKLGYAAALAVGPRARQPETIFSWDGDLSDEAAGGGGQRERRFSSNVGTQLVYGQTLT